MGAHINELVRDLCSLSSGVYQLNLTVVFVQLTNNGLLHNNMKLCHVQHSFNSLYL